MKQDSKLFRMKRLFFKLHDFCNSNYVVSYVEFERMFKMSADNLRNITSPKYDYLQETVLNYLSIERAVIKHLGQGVSKADIKLTLKTSRTIIFVKGERVDDVCMYSSTVGAGMRVARAWRRFVMTIKRQMRGLRCAGS